MMKNFLKLLDVSKDDIMDLLNLADQLKYEQKHNIPHKKLDGKTLGMIFRKESTRTRVSFETGMYQLGGHALFLSAKDLQLEKGELISDTARTLSRYLDGMMMRTNEQKELDLLAGYSRVPIINGMTDLCHPCQVLADLLTIREFKQQFEGLKICYVGDGRSAANSLIVGALKVGMKVAAACPENYEPDITVLDFAKSCKDNFLLTKDPLKAADGADVIFTDIWYTSSGDPDRELRRQIFRPYQVNDDLIAAANPGVTVQHCLPAHKGEEITEKVFEAHADEIFEETENRLHAQKAVMLRLMGS